MLNKTEDEITTNWDKNISTPIVSILCITFNHELYISEALDSFLMQVTDFPFEIVIGEDCSTDNTRKLLQKYHKKFPNIIQLIQSEENVGMHLNFKRTTEACQGDFIALCEGDDYWTDINKLQIQLTEMKKKPNCNISFHPANKLVGNTIGETKSKHAKNNKIFSTSEVILGDGGFCPSASLMLKKDIFADLPKWLYKETPVLDYFIQVIASLKHGALYINKTMAIYRLDATSSWSNSQKNKDNKIKWFKQMMKSLDLLDKFSNDEYSKEIDVMRNKHIYNMLKNRTLDVDSKKTIYKKYRSLLSFKQRFRWYSILLRSSSH